MGNYFDRERKLALATKEFNKKLDILENQCRKDLETFFDETIYEDGNIMNTAAWYNFKHSIVVEAALSFDYATAIDNRIRDFKTQFSLTESLVLGEDANNTQRITALSNTLDKVIKIREAVEGNSIKEAVMGIRDILPIYCLFENDAAEKVEEALEKAKKDAEEEQKKIEKEDEEKSEEVSEDEKDSDSDDKDDDTNAKDEDNSDDEDDKNEKSEDSEESDSDDDVKEEE